MKTGFTLDTSVFADPVYSYLYPLRKYMVISESGFEEKLVQLFISST